MGNRGLAWRLRWMAASDRRRLARLSREHPGFQVDPSASSALGTGTFHLYEGAQVRVAPDEDAEIGAVLPYHTPVVIRSQPVGDGRWWALIDALGPGVDGYLDDRRSLRHPMPAPDRPLEVGDDELWIDVELDQQVLHPKLN